jgi:radical SAM superfamily enzyme YgiQ (UPF0313 family)
VLLKEAQKDQPDYHGAWKRALNDALTTFAHPVVGVSLMFESTADHFDEICRHVRATKPDAAILCGGVAATADPDRMLRDRLVDMVFLHEAENSLPEFLAFAEGKPASPCNMVFRDGQGLLHRLPGDTGGPVNIDIRSEYAKIDIADYCNVGSLSSLSRMNGRETPYAAMLSRRGCRARCSFCGVRNFNGKGVRVRTVDGVVAEMTFLRDNYGVRHFDWLDDDLLYGEDDAIRLFDHIGERLPDITWVANNGLIASAMSPEILAAMQRSGCTAYRIGLESGNPEVLRQIHKPTNLEKFFDYARMAEDFPEMLVSVNFIIGFPTETIGQMRDSFVAAAVGGLDWNSFYVYQHLKNTELYLAHSDITRAGFDTDYSKEGQALKSYLRDSAPEMRDGKDNNPVRALGFRDMDLTTDVARGYDVFDLPGGMVPDQDQLKEVWFTYNMVANFLLMPALRSNSLAQRENGANWVASLQHAYPQDASMASLLYCLEHRLGRKPAAELRRLRDDAFAKLRQSDYWQCRDQMFRFSALLDSDLPPLDARCAAYLRAGGFKRFDLPE